MAGQSFQSGQLYSHCIRVHCISMYLADNDHPLRPPKKKRKKSLLTLPIEFSFLRLYLFFTDTVTLPLTSTVPRIKLLPPDPFSSSPHGSTFPSFSSKWLIQSDSVTTDKGSKPELFYKSKCFFNYELLSLIITILCLYLCSICLQAHTNIRVHRSNIFYK